MTAGMGIGRLTSVLLRRGHIVCAEASSHRIHHCELWPVQVLQRYFTPHSAAMAEYALASAVMHRMKSNRAVAMGESSRLSPVQSIGDKEGITCRGQASKMLCSCHS